MKMGILKYKKDDWTETLAKGYTFEDDENEEVAGFFLFYKPYTRNMDFTKNGLFHMHDRNVFRDMAYFDDSGNSFLNSPQHDRI